MFLEKRKTQILDFIIRDYIRHGLPVSSGRIYKKIDVEAAPATIRHLMSELEDDRFLEQPHISSGRVPTDKAYRYFVDYLMNLVSDRNITDEMKVKESDEIKEMASSDPLKEMNKIISEATKLFTLMADFGRKKQLNLCGVQRLLDEPEFTDGGLLRNFAGLFDNLYEIADVYRRRFDDETVFIGRENPLEETRMMSVLGGKIQKKEKDVTLLIIGPKRMNYEYNCSILRYFLKNDSKRI